MCYNDKCTRHRQEKGYYRQWPRPVLGTRQWLEKEPCLANTLDQGWPKEQAWRACTNNVCLWHQAYKEEKYHFLKETRTPKEEKDLDEFVNQTLKNRLHRSI